MTDDPLRVLKGPLEYNVLEYGITLQQSHASRRHQRCHVAMRILVLQTLYCRSTSSLAVLDAILL